ncbi:hypothetical protein [Mycobacteroides abscessus]|uniref:hypothetical protein n=1 Tax=Mycobacteroides abscessus TaxID=36809 RepID=UPI00092777E8|nr:hypothetical protein [Mycobacteroides abscessus]SHQ48921.1 Uncharacterised protein [Mycobacteroides abscessus subsp. abscessus]SKQ84969.1 Uncharacterised protein [Mycobacteroides abscessus subsp. massiliense]SLC49288.1 Uncharacterised protein [Mycobacteroides abscessus subsp. massiliense]
MEISVVGHALAQLIDAVKAANGWSDPDLVENARARGYELTKSNISRYRNEQPLISIKGDTVRALAAALGVTDAQVAAAAVESMGISLPRYQEPRIEQSVRLDPGLSKRDQDLLLVLLSRMRDTDAGGAATDVKPPPATSVVQVLNSPLSRAADDSNPARYPWVVWTVELLDPDRLAGENVAERTATAASAAARKHGCVYEYCVDEDTLEDGTNYYKWYMGVTRAEHENCVGNVPVVVTELVTALIGVLPRGCDSVARWTAAPSAHATRIRNEVNHGYPGID